MTTCEDTLKTNKMVVMAIVLVTILFAVGYSNRVLLQSFVSPAQCGETAETSTPSPDGHIIATTYTRNCGATTDVVTHVNLHSHEDMPLPNSEGIIAEGEIFSQVGSRKIRVVWLTKTELSLSSPDGSASSKSADLTWGSVRIHVNL